MTKLFNVVGVSRVRDGAALKIRVANGKPERRARILDRNGHADVVLFSVEPSVSKDDALVWLQTNHAEYAAQLTPRKTKAAKAVNEAVEAVVETAEAVVETAEAVVEEAAVVETVELTAEQKLAAKRARDAQRKREKRAAAKLAAA